MRAKQQIIENIAKRGSARPAELASQLGITPQALHRHLKQLCQRGVLSRVGSAPSTRYTLTPLPLPLGQNAESHLSQIGRILGAHPAVLLVTVFGSFARGTARPTSDIDVMVWLAPEEGFDRRDIWEYWDRQSRHLSWSGKVSIVTQPMRPRLSLNTLLLDLPEEHIPVYDRRDYYPRLRQAILGWRERNGAIKIASFGGKHSWRYSTKTDRLENIDFELEVENVS